MNGVIQLSVRKQRTHEVTRDGETHRVTKFTGDTARVTVSASEIVLHTDDPRFDYGSIVELRGGRKLHVRETYWTLNWLRSRASRAGYHHYDGRKHKAEYDAWRAEIFDTAVPPWMDVYRSDPDSLTPDDIPLDVPYRDEIVRNLLRAKKDQDAHTFTGQPTDADLDEERHGNPHDTGRSLEGEEAQDREWADRILLLQSQLRWGWRMELYHDERGISHVRPVMDPETEKPQTLTESEKEALEGELGEVAI